MLRPYFIIVFFLVAGFLGYFLIWPVYQEVARTQAEIEGIETDIQEGERYFAELKKTSEELEKYQDQISTVKSALPERFYPPHLYDFFQKITSRHGLLLGGMTHSIGSLGDSEIQQIQINLSISGSYSAIKNFLSYLQSSVRFFSIGNISISSEGGEPFGCSLNISTYSYRK